MDASGTRQVRSSITRSPARQAGGRTLTTATARVSARRAASGGSPTPPCARSGPCDGLDHVQTPVGEVARQGRRSGGLEASGPACGAGWTMSFVAVLLCLAGLVAL